MTLDFLPHSFSSLYFPLEEKVSLFGRKKKAIVIAGPTAVGKTDMSTSLAQIIGGEVISADSMQIYKGMDIGTAKVPPNQRDEVPHHLIDICTLDTTFNVVQYFHQARIALKEILNRENVPFIVGGSGFYVHVFLYGPPPGPPPNPDVRKHLEKQLDLLGSEVLYEQLQMLDPEYAQTITERDKHKIIRALEIITLTEKKVSDFARPTPDWKGDYDFRCWFCYYPKEILYPKIERRCEKMVEEGFIEEVKILKEKGLENNSTASNAIGYKQCLDYLNTKQTKTDFENFMEAFKKASRRYAKRQFTWFKKEAHFRWINLDEIDMEDAKELILQDYEQI